MSTRPQAVGDYLRVLRKQRSCHRERGNAQHGERGSAFKILATINFAVAIFVVKIVDALVDLKLGDGRVIHGICSVEKLKSRNAQREM